MLGNFNERLDKKACILSLLTIAIITFAISILDIQSLINISGIFKQ